MSKVLKKRLLTVALAIMLCSTLGAVASVKRLTVKADSTVAYEIVGASIRTTEPEGLRFTASISKTDYETLKSDNTDITFGLAFVPSSYITKYGELNAENLFGENAKYGEGKAAVVNQKSKDLFYDAKHERYELRVALVNLSAEQLTTDFSAVSYYILNGDTTPTYHFGSTYCVRNVAQVATLALSDSDDTEKTVIENILQKAYTENTKIKTAEHLHYLLTHNVDSVGLQDNRKVYTIENDIDMSELAAVQGDEHQIQMFATIDGKGHKVSNLAYKGYAIWRSRCATIKNIVFENLKATTDTTDFVSFFRESIGITAENVYMSVAVDANNRENVFVSALFDNANVDTTSEQKISLKNVIANFTAVTNATTVSSLSVARKLQTNDTINAEYDDVYLVNGSSYAGAVLQSLGNGKFNVTVNGTEYTTGVVNAVNADAVVKSIGWLTQYKDNFTADIWTDILVVDNARFVQEGYTVIDSKEKFEELCGLFNGTASVGNKYVLTADIDATGITVVGEAAFTGEINGLGHTVSNLSIKGCLIRTMGGSMSNIAFINTEFKNGSINTVGLFNQVNNVSLKNVYVDMKITLSESVFLAPFGGSVNGTLTLTNAVAKIGFTADSTATPTAIGAVWMANASNNDSSVNMNGVYLIKGENYGSNNSTGLVNWLRSRNSHTATVKVVNGTDAEYVQSNNTGADIKDGYAKGYTFDNYSALVAAGKGYEKALTSKVFNAIKG